MSCVFLTHASKEFLIGPAFACFFFAWNQNVAWSPEEGPIPKRSLLDSLLDGQTPAPVGMDDAKPQDFDFVHPQHASTLNCSVGSDGVAQRTSAVCRATSS